MAELDGRAEGFEVNVVDRLPEPHRSVFIEVIGERAPDVLASLRRSEVPTFSEWRAVTHALDDATAEHWLPDRADYELDERGLAIDYALGAFLNVFLVDDLPDRPGSNDR